VRARLDVYDAPDYLRVMRFLALKSTDESVDSVALDTPPCGHDRTRGRRRRAYVPRRRKAGNKRGRPRVFEWEGRLDASFQLSWSTEADGAAGR
jgi:hypothetical protein